MLPGFRILFAMVLLSAGVLVFGLGAVSLLHSAHTSFVSQPTWLAPADVARTSRNEREPATLALLRVGEPAAASSPVAEMKDPPPPTPEGTESAEARDRAPVEPPGAAAEATPPDPSADIAQQPSESNTSVASSPAAPDDAPAGTVPPSSSDGAASAQEPASAISEGPRVDGPAADATVQAQTAAAAGENTPATPAATPSAADTDGGQAVPVKLAALPDQTAPRAETKPAQTSTTAKTAKQRAADLRAQKRARARLRARRLAAARARAARLAQINQQATSAASAANNPFGLPTMR